MEESGDVEVDERRYRIPYILIDVMTRVISGCTSERAYTGKEMAHGKKPVFRRKDYIV